MSSTKEYLHFILEQLEDITYRPMMGEYILYYRQKIVGGIYDNRLLIKPTKSALAMLPTAEFSSPYEGAKELLMPDCVEDKALLNALFAAMYEELPMPKQKK